MRATEKRLGGSHSVGISSLDALPPTDWTELERSTWTLSAQPPRAQWLVLVYVGVLKGILVIWIGVGYL